MSENDAIEVDEHSCLSIPSIWLVGAVTDRVNLPVAIFSQPPIGEVGVNEEQVKGLEEKMKEQEKQLSCSSVADSAVKLAKSTPLEVKNPIRDEPVNESERRVLRSSSVFNRQLIQGPASVKDKSHQNVRRKKLSKNWKMENNHVYVAVMTSDKRSRKSNPPRPPSRTTRATPKPVIPVIHAKTGREMMHKEKENKKRMWS